MSPRGTGVACRARPVRIWWATGSAVPPAVFRPARSRVPGGNRVFDGKRSGTWQRAGVGNLPDQAPRALSGRTTRATTRRGAACAAVPCRFRCPLRKCGSPAKAPRKARRFGRAFFGIAAAVRTSGRPAAVAVTFPGAPCCSGVPALFALLCLLRRTIAGAARWGVANAFPFFAGGVRSLSLVEIRCGTRAVPFFRRARETRCLRTRMRFFPLTAFPTPL